MPVTVVHRTPRDAVAVRLEGARRLALADGLFQSTAPAARIESGPIETGSPFDRLVGSWNADVPRDASLEMQAQVGFGAGWSPWFSLARTTGAEFQSVERQERPAGLVDTDTLALPRAAGALRYRFLIAAPRRPVTIRLATVTVSGPKARAPAPFRPGPWVRELKVRPRSQMEEQERIKRDVCSPASVAMALEFWGQRRSTAAVAEGARDRRTGIFGHWPFNAAYAGSQDVEAYVSYLAGYDELQELIAHGRPVVASVTFGPGELAGAPLPQTRGHLLLVVGFTPDGDVIALDPAAESRKAARRIYDRAQFFRAWMLNKRGVAYVIGPLAGRRLSAGIPVADLLAKPRAGASLLTQLLYGETVTVLRVRDGFAEVLADEQADLHHAGVWKGYRGWVSAGALVSARPQPPDVVVRARQAAALGDGAPLLLSVGTRLRRLADEAGVSTVALLDGTTARLESAALYAPPPSPDAGSRGRIIKTAELFLGTAYYWGGRSGVQPDASLGVDCSGLVHLAYRVEGLDLPRDAHEQWLRGRAVPRAELGAADLVFLTEPDRPRHVNHVMLYTGGDGLLESRKSSGRVLRCTFLERFGKPLSALESGDWVLDRAQRPIQRRRIRFASYLFT